MCCIEDPCCNFTHVNMVNTMALLHNFDHVVMRIDVIEDLLGKLGNLPRGACIDHQRTWTTVDLP